MYPNETKERPINKKRVDAAKKKLKGRVKTNK